MSRMSILRPLRLMTMVTALVAMGGLSFLSPLTADAAGSSVTLTVHYYRFDNNYTNWNLWSWVNTQTGSDCSISTTPNGEGAFQFTGSDSFGVYGSITYSCTSGAVTSIGLIVRQTGWVNREPPGNRILNVSAGQNVDADYVVSGDSNDYPTLAAANAAKYTLVNTAKFSGAHTINTTLTKAFKLTPSGQGWELRDKTKKKTYKATNAVDGLKYPGIDAVAEGDFQKAAGNTTNWDPASTKTKMKQVSGDLYQYTVTLPAGTYNYNVAVGGAASCGTCHSYPSSNVSLELDGKEQVTFYFVPYGDQVYDSVNNPTAALPPNGVGFATTAVNVTFKKATLSKKDVYILSGPGVPGVTIKNGLYKRPVA